MTRSRLLPLALIIGLASVDVARAAASDRGGSAGVLFSSRFEAGPLADAGAFKVTGGGSAGKAAVVAEGTIDAYMGTPTPALRWTLAGGSAGATARVTTPPLTVKNAEADLGRLSLGVDLWVSQLRPVRLLISSLNADGTTGTLATTLIPPVAGAYYRFTPDLASFRPAGGTFDPRAGRVTVAFEVAAADGALPDGELVLKADNLSYAAPAYYVSPTGRDTNDGRTEATAFATPQKAADAAAPGDVILLAGGTYVSKDREPLVRLNRSGGPDRWIVMRAAPGQTPVLRGTGWDVVTVGTKTSYVEFRGLIVRGYADEISHDAAQADEQVRQKDGKSYGGDPRMNTNGFAADGRKGDENDGHPHHLRFIHNTVRHQPGAGIGLCAPDHVTIEGNVTEDNCHTMRYASSGISILSAWNFDADNNYKLFIVGNRSARNRCYVKWSEINKISDGNGVIIDQFIQFDYKTNKPGDRPYTGRTLVQNNLVYSNGGSGIHAFASNHVDIVNNTAYHNAQSPELSWRQIFASSKCRDIRIVNNILWAQKGKPVHVKMGDSKDVIYANNLIVGDGDNEGAEGGGLGTSKGGAMPKLVNPVTGRPGLVRPSLDAADADFRLAPGSAAIGAGDPTARGVPLTDLDGKIRPKDRTDLGAYAAPR